MSIIRALKKPAQERSIGFPYGYGPFFGGGGVTVAGTTQQALTNAASLAAIDVLQDAIGRTPIDCVRVQGNRRIPVTPTPKIIANPSGLTTDDVWRSQLGFSLATDGNAFGTVTQMQGTYPSEVELHDPSVVSREVKNGKKWIGIQGDYDTTWDNGGKYWHMPGRIVQPGTPYGTNLVELARKTIGTSLAAEDFSNRFFTDGGHPTHAIKASTALTPDDASKIKQAFMHLFSGRSREPVVYGDGLDIQQLSTNPGETQFIELLQWCAIQAARVWHVPPAMIFASVQGSSITYANVLDADLSYLKHTLDGYYSRLETALTQLVPRPQIVKVNRNAILRAEVAGRIDVYDVRLRNKTMTVNEVRALEDEEPFDDPIYDEPGIPGITPDENAPVVDPNADPTAGPTPKDTNGPDA